MAPAQTRGDGEAVTDASVATAFAEGFPGFEVSIKPGSSIVELVRVSSPGEATVRVELECCTPEMWGQEEPEMDEEGMEDAEPEEPEPVQALPATVFVGKPGADGVVVFQLAIPTEEDTGVEIGTVFAAEDSNATLDTLQELNAYSPPAFTDLDFGLQASFAGYLAGLGIDDDFADRVRDLAELKEQLEYVRWMGGIKRIVQA